MKRSNQIGWAQVRGGIFILFPILGIAGGILLMGQKTKIFVTKGQLRVMLDDVTGLKEGAPVWLAGVDVGVVTAISFRSPKTSNEVEILLEADHKALHKIGKDSLITIKTRGLMGEKYVDITPSQLYSETPPTVLHGVSVVKLDDVMQKAGATFDRVNLIVDSVTQGKGTLGKLTNDPQLYDNIVRLTGEVNTLARAMNHGEGSLGKLVRNPEPYNRLTSILNRADQTMQAFQASDGSLNRLIHDKTLYTKLVNLTDTSVQAANDVRELNRKLASKESTLGMLINDREFYDKGISLLNRADNSVKSVEEITARVNRGEGTLGKAINDKELYERMNKMVDSMNLLMTDIKSNPGRYVKFSLF